MKLYRYDKTCLCCYQLKEWHFYVKLPISNDVNADYIYKHGIRGLFCSTDYIKHSLKAREALSLTYCPTSLNEIDVSSIGNLELRTHNFLSLQTNLNTQDVPRVWPSFGRIGGFHELLVTKPDFIGPQYVNRRGHLTSFCLDDPYHQDNTQDYDYPFTGYLINAIRAGVVNSDYKTEDGDYLYMKIDRNTLSTSLSSKSDRRKISLSAAYAAEDRFTTIWLWGAMYEDSGVPYATIRKILRPIVRVITLSVGKTELTRDDGTLGGNFNKVTEQVTDIMSVLARFNLTKFSSMSMSFRLPH